MRRISLRSLFIASFSGRVIFAISNIVALPFYARILGAEAVGIIGFFSTLLMIMTILEGGLTSSVIQSLARAKQMKAYAPRRYGVYIYSIINTYIIAFVVVGIISVVGVVAVAQLLAVNWLVAKELPPSVLAMVIKWMGLFIGLNFPVMILQGILMGREMQLPMNVLYGVYALLRTFGVVFALTALDASADIEAFFVLQIGFQILYLIGLLFVVYKDVGSALWRYVPHWRLVSNGFQYGRNIFLLSFTSVFVVQFDKIYLSGWLSLDKYAAYSLASTIASLPYIFSSALYAVLFPRFAADVAAQDGARIGRVFNAAFCGITVMMVVTCIVIWMFSIAPLRLLFDRQLAVDISVVLPPLMIGTALQSLLMVPFALQLAYKWTSLALRLNLVLVPCFLFLLPLMVEKFGAVGAGYAWLAYNVASFLFTMLMVVGRFEYLRSSLLLFGRVLVFMLLLSVPVYYLISVVAPEASSDLVFSLGIALVSLGLVSIGMVRFRKELAGFV